VEVKEYFLLVNLFPTFNSKKMLSVKTSNAISKIYRNVGFRGFFLHVYFYDMAWLAHIVGLEAHIETVFRKIFLHFVMCI